MAKFQTCNEFPFKWVFGLRHLTQGSIIHYEELELQQATAVNLFEYFFILLYGGPIMARLPILAALMSASLMTQAAMPEWMSKVGEYCTLDACSNGWKNTSAFVVKQATALKEAVVEHPYYAAAIAAGTMATGYVAKKCYNARKAYNKRMQEVQDRILAEQLQLMLQDEEFARELERQFNGQAPVVIVETLSDEATARMLELMLQDEEFARQLNAELNGQPHVQPVYADAAMAERLSRELTRALHEQALQVEADFAYAQSLVEVD